MAWCIFLQDVCLLPGFVATKLGLLALAEIVPGGCIVPWWRLKVLMSHHGTRSPLTSPGPLTLPSTHSAPQPSPFSSAPSQLLPRFLPSLTSSLLPEGLLHPHLPLACSHFCQKSHPSFATHTPNFVSFLICLLSSCPVV